MLKSNTLLSLLFILISSLALSQKSVFWDKLETYNKVNKTVSKYMEMNAYTNSTTGEIHESGYGNIYSEGDNLMIKLPEGIFIGNNEWAIQIIEQQKSIVVTEAIAQDNSQTSHLNFMKALLEMNKLGTLEYKETDKEYILSSSDVKMGQYRKVAWYFNKVGVFDIKRTIVYFNEMNLTDNTSSGGTGADYTLQEPRLEIVYLNKEVTPILVDDVIKVTSGKIKLAEAYSRYSLIDMTERYEAPKSQN